MRVEVSVNIASHGIIVASRSEDAGVVKIASLWRANADVPSMAKRSYRSGSSGDDFADWNASNFAKSLDQYLRA